MDRGKRLLAVMGVLSLLVSVEARANVRFYQNLLERGKTAYQAGKYESAAQYLEIAAFGFLESLPDYETAEIYLALANHRLGRDDQARGAIESVMRAEQVKPTYRTLALDPGVRSAFETAIATLMPSQTLRNTAAPTTVRQQPAGTPASASPGDEPAVIPKPAQPLPTPVVPTPVVPTPAVPALATSTAPNGSEQAAEAPATTPVKTETPVATPSTAGTATVAPTTAPASVRSSEQAPAAPAYVARIISTPEIRDLEALLAKQPDSTSVQLALADAHLRAGNLDPASDLATKVVRKEPTNAIAHTYLARIAKRRGNMGEAIFNYRAAEASGPLSDEDYASLFVCYVTQGDYASARSLEPGLTESARHDPSVAKAIGQLENAPEKPPANSSPGEAPPATGKLQPTAQSLSPQPGRSLPEASASVTRGHTASPSDKEDVFISIREARRDAARGDCASATRIYDHLLTLPSLERYVLLAVGRGLGACQAWADSLRAYSRAEPLGPGEEDHIFRVAVDQYHLGNLAAAREYLDRALPNLERTDEVRRYIDLIQGTR